MSQFVGVISALLATWFLVTAIPHCSASLDSVFDKVKCVTEQEDDQSEPSPCCLEMHKFLQEVCQQQKLTIAGNEYAVINDISFGNARNPAHVRIEETLKRNKKRYLSARFYPATVEEGTNLASKLAQYEEDVIAKLQASKATKSKVFPVLVVSERRECFTVLLTDAIGDDMDKERDNDGLLAPVKADSVHNDLFGDMMEALVKLEAAKLEHNNISPDSLSWIDPQLKDTHHKSSCCPISEHRHCRIECFLRGETVLSQGPQTNGMLG